MCLLQAAELKELEEYKRGDLGASLGRAYLRLDDLLRDEANAPALRALAGDPDHPERRWGGGALCTGGLAVGVFWLGAPCVLVRLSVMKMGVSSLQSRGQDFNTAGMCVL